MRLGGVIHRADLPLLQRVLATLAQPLRLFFMADVEVVLEDESARAHQQLFEVRHRPEERLVLLRSAEVHDWLDAGAVVPAAIEQHDLLRRWQVAHVPLEVPLGLLAVTRLARRHDPRLARTQMLDDALDGAVLTGAVATLED